jgi:hypothetical protein
MPRRLPLHRDQLLGTLDIEFLGGILDRGVGINCLNGADPT